MVSSDSLAFSDSKRSSGSTESRHYAGSRSPVAPRVQLIPWGPVNPRVLVAPWGPVATMWHSGSVGHSGSLGHIVFVSLSGLFGHTGSMGHTGFVVWEKRLRGALIPRGAHWLRRAEWLSGAQWICRAQQIYRAQWLYTDFIGCRGSWECFNVINSSVLSEQHTPSRFPIVMYTR